MSGNAVLFGLLRRGWERGIIDFAGVNESERESSERLAESSEKANRCPKPVNTFASEANTVIPLFSIALTWESIGPNA